MHRAKPAAMHRFRLDALPAEPWRNGGGVTRTVAVDGTLSGLDWRWRISAADIGQDGPFSSFTRVDRRAVLIAGRGLSLQGEAGPLDFEHVGDSHCFAGDRPWNARLRSGPCRLWNVMTRRGSARSETRPLGPVERFLALPRTGSTPPLEASETQIDLVFVLHGGYRVTNASSAAFDLPPGEGLVRLPGAAALELRACGAGAGGLLTSVFAPSPLHDTGISGEPCT